MEQHIRYHTQRIFQQLVTMLIQPVIFDTKGKGRKSPGGYTWTPGEHTSLSSTQSESPVSVNSEVYMPKTLHVEDNAEIRSIVNYFLRKQYDINFAEDGNSALDLVRQENYDVIIMDINLGEGIDGIETARQIRQMDTYKEVPIIAVTANLSSQTRDHCLQAGMDAFLPKPFRKDDLINTINFVLERRSTAI
ncbi:MAG: two component signal transductions system response regulator [Bacteroidetes bacterium HLUCCA01]|nr:MAG: two component signal transductions system response regulator [Bacteroidetes bacterium HLUCCA01]